MVEEMRSKWCEDLEELLQCPVCFERLKGIVVQCERGHHICHQCKSHMTECPMCKCKFNGTRSYLIEELSTKLDDIKLSLINPMDAVVKKVSAASQTDAKINTSEVKQVTHTPPKIGKGKYPCRINNCTANIGHGRMTNHIRYFHRNKFYESFSKDGGNSYEQAWQVEYQYDTVFDVALRIAEMGLFFLNIFIDITGDVYGTLQIVNSNYIGRQFTYKLKVKSNQRCCSFFGEIRSCRVPLDTLYDLNCLHVNCEDMTRMTADSGRFICALSIKRKPIPAPHDTNTRNHF